MKILLSSRGLFSLCFIVLVATNIIVLSGVASNRSGKPESHTILTERELKLPYRVHEENSGLALRITWRALGKISDNNSYSDWRSPAWFSAEKLEKLGFNINDFLNSNRKRSFYKRSILKEVFIVLENNGEAYREAVKRAKLALKREENSFKLDPGNKRLRDNFERAKKRLKREYREESRLFAIDAGLDASELRKKYNDRTHFIITKGLVKPRLNHNKNKEEVSGYISRLSVVSINVPLEHRQIFDSILARGKSYKNDSRSPRFEVKLAYGTRLEPWIMSVRPLDDNS